jgi:hypothetical protein
MKRLLSAVIVGTSLILAFAQGTMAQQLTLPDGKYASPAAYLAGLWKWERQEPRQTMIMRLGGDGTFFFHNFTVDIQHWGKFTATADKLNIMLSRTCEKQGSDCSDYDPPKRLDYPYVPTGADVFMSSAERWERMK